MEKSIAIRKPPRLKRGGTIGVVATAGCVDADSLSRGINVLKKQGFEIALSPRIHERKGYLAGDERQRARDLQEFFQRPDIDAIFCARGGFGSIQLLPHLNVEAIRSNPKIFVGCSDVTILLNWVLQHCGIVTLHGPMVAMEFARGVDGRTKEYFWQTILGEKESWETKLTTTIQPGIVEAPMVGGCLSLLVTTLGTPYEIDTGGKLLFLEDVGEKPYRIERMLTHLKMAGKLDRLAGLVFGDFIQCEPEGPRGIMQIITEMFRDAPYPVLMGLAAGHGEENLTLPFGVKMALDGHTGTLSLLESPVT